MMKMYLSFLIINFSIFMLKLNHPLSMGLMILLQTMLICLLSGMLIKTYWFSYILFLTFLGGMLVLFIYVSSIASNELFKLLSFNIKLLFIIFMMFFLMMIFFMNFKWMNFNFNSDMIDLNNSLLIMNNENNLNLTKLYNNQTFILMMMLIIYLFITLVSIVKITNIFYGPLRSSF
uniref:NADH dehydrogenase subunit 6 n=1 Tax=Issikiopteryx taipingensis TaxID=2939475 RepID=UPI0020299208|nr:NADH dehydrogenase subunit 6 [Issikiopteryx taipingensis]UPU95818.1 NADH dehydrogenase subunit 6 [Issikiopteryx taipingensis]